MQAGEQLGGLILSRVQRAARACTLAQVDDQRAQAGPTLTA